MMESTIIQYELIDLSPSGMTQLSQLHVHTHVCNAYIA